MDPCGPGLGVWSLPGTQGPAAWRDSEHPVRWAWTSHRDRHQEGLALTERKDLASATIIWFTTPAAARSWLRGL